MEISWENILYLPFFYKGLAIDKPDAQEQLLTALKDIYCLYQSNPTPPKSEDIKPISANQAKLANIGYNISYALKQLDADVFLDETKEQFLDQQGKMTFPTFCRQSLENIRDNLQRVGLLEQEPAPESDRRKAAHYDRIEDYQYLASHAQTSASNAMNSETEASKAEAAAKAAQQTAESIVPNMLAVLGIFVAIVIAVVATYLSVLILSHGEGEHFRVLSLPVGLLMGHVLINVIFLLLYLTSKLTGKTVAVSCKIHHTRSCDSCPNSDICRSTDQLWYRYPYIVLLNSMFFLGYLAVGLWTVTGSYIAQPVIATLDRCPWTVVVVYFAAAAAIFLIWLIFHPRLPKRVKKREKKNAEQPQPRKAPLKKVWATLKSMASEAISCRKEMKNLKLQLADYEHRLEALEAVVKQNLPKEGPQVPVAASPNSLTDGEAKP